MVFVPVTPTKEGIKQQTLEACSITPYTSWYCQYAKYIVTSLSVKPCALAEQQAVAADYCRCDRGVRSCYASSTWYLTTLLPRGLGD